MNQWCVEMTRREISPPEITRPSRTGSEVRVNNKKFNSPRNGSTMKKIDTRETIYNRKNIKTLKTQIQSRTLKTHITQHFFCMFLIFSRGLIYERNSSTELTHGFELVHSVRCHACPVTSYQSIFSKCHSSILSFRED